VKKGVNLMIKNRSIKSLSNRIDKIKWDVSDIAYKIFEYGKIIGQLSKQLNANQNAEHDEQLKRKLESCWMKIAKLNRKKQICIVSHNLLVYWLNLKVDKENEIFLIKNTADQSTYDYNNQFREYNKSRFNEVLLQIFSTAGLVKMNSIYKYVSLFPISSGDRYTFIYKLALYEPIN
jgi:hypothetical protein